LAQAILVKGISKLCQRSRFQPHLSALRVLPWLHGPGM